MNHITLGYTEDGLFAISHEVLRQHAYIIGKSGTGKTTLLENMIWADIRAGRGFCIVDPHGSLTDRIADAVGNREAIYFNPLSHGPVPKYNPCNELSHTAIATRVDHISEALEHIHSDSWGPRMEDCLKNALFLAIENNLSLADIPRILQDEPFRSSLTCNNPAVNDYFQNEYGNYKDAFREQVISPILNKLREFDRNPLLKNIIDGESTLDIPAIMGNPEYKNRSWHPRKAKIFLVSLSKRMGTDPSHVIGSLIVSRIAQAALERETVPEEHRQDFTLYIDEFQNFTSRAMADILDEARKYRLRLVLAHQRRAQIINPNLKDAVLGTASTLIVFRVGSHDAKELAPELGLFDSHGGSRPRLLSDLPNYQAYVKTMNGTVQTPPTLIQTVPANLPTGSMNRVQKATVARYTRRANTRNEGSNGCAFQSSMGPKPRGCSKRRRSTRSRSK